MEKIEWDDLVLPFQLDKSDLRGRSVRLDKTVAEALAQHSYPNEVCGLLAEAIALTALIGQTVKLRWKLSLQIRGDGPIRIIATDYYGPQEEGEPAKIRAYASVDYDRLDRTTGSAFSKIGKGMFAILIDQGPDMKPYQGVTPLAGGSLSACAESYFAQSEQLPTKFNITVAQSQTANGSGWRTGGIMLQMMPMASPLMAKPDVDAEDGLLTAADLLPEDKEEGWNRATSHLATADETELLGPILPMPEVLYRLFHEDSPRIFDVQPVEFGCTCSADKVRFSLSMYGEKDIEKMTSENGMVTADCQFCGAHYELDPKTVGKDV